MENKKNKIIFINPFICKKGNGTIGIAHIRGFLNKKNITSSMLNVNDAILRNEKYINELFSHVRKMHLVLDRKEKRDKKLRNIYGIFIKIFDLDSDKFWEFISKNNKLNLFREIYSCFGVGRYVGFSITYYEQLYFALLSACYLKFYVNKDIKIIFGGPYVFSKANEIIKLINGKDIVDFIVLGEGEKAVRDLIFEKNCDQIPNLIYRKNGCFIYSKCREYSMPVEEYAAPSFGSDVVFPVLKASNGMCYWDRCSFCSNYNNNCTNQLSIRPAKDVVKDIQDVFRSNNKFNYIYFADSAFTKSQLIGLVEELEINKITKKDYRIFLRLEPWISEELLVRANKVGFGRGRGKLAFGLETTSQRLIDLMQKGIKIEVVDKIFKICARNNISIQVNLIGMLPTQTKEELVKDLEYCLKILKKYKKSDLVFIKFTVFYLLKDSDVYHNQQKYRIKEIKSQKNNFNYKITFKQLDKRAIQTSDEALEIYQKFVNDLPEEHKNSFMKIL